MRRTAAKTLIALLVLLGAFRLLFPGDVPFINDEPMIIENALDANEAGSVVSSGLSGTRGATYGPVPTWFYQTALSLTSDLRWVAVARIVLVTALTGLALVLVAVSVNGISPALGAFAFLSPYLWFYARDLWDNSFSIPFAGMLLGAYTLFLKDGRLRSFAVAALFGTLALMTHLMTLPLVGAVALHFALTRWRTMRDSPRFALGVALVLAGSLALCFPYLREMSGSSVATFRVIPSLGPVAFALNGMRVFSLAGFDYVIGPWNLGGIAPIAIFLTIFSYVGGAYGLVLCIREVRAGDGSVRGQLAAVLTLALVLFVLMANGQRLREHPHYYSGVWIVFFCFWWIGMSRLVHEAWLRRIFVGQVVVMACFLVGVVSWIHWNRGTKSLHYGPTLENQMTVARQLNLLGAPDAPPSAAHHPRLFPHAIGVLRRLEPGGGDGPAEDLGPGPDGVEIVYVDPQGTSGAIMVRVHQQQISLR